MERDQHVAADGTERIQKKEVASPHLLKEGTGILLLISESQRDDTQDQTFNNYHRPPPHPYPYPDPPPPQNDPSHPYQPFVSSAVSLSLIFHSVTPCYYSIVITRFLSFSRANFSGSKKESIFFLSQGVFCFGCCGIKCSSMSNASLGCEDYQLKDLSAAT